MTLWRMLVLTANVADGVIAPAAGDRTDLVFATEEILTQRNVTLGCLLNEEGRCQVCVKGGHQNAEGAAMCNHIMVPNRRVVAPGGGCLSRHRFRCRDRR